MASLDSYSCEISAGIVADWSSADLVRLMAQAVEDFQRLDRRDDEVSFLAEPRPTGDVTGVRPWQRWPFTCVDLLSGRPHRIGPEVRVAMHRTSAG